MPAFPPRFTFYRVDIDPGELMVRKLRMEYKEMARSVAHQQPRRHRASIANTSQAVGIEKPLDLSRPEQTKKFDGCIFLMLLALIAGIGLIGALCYALFFGPAPINALP